MARKGTKFRPWTEEDIRILTTLTRAKAKTSVIARRLNRSAGATHLKATRLGMTLGIPRKKRRG